MYALPFDIELSVEDIERIWNDDNIDPADRVAVHGMSEGQLILSTETALLNLSTLLNRLQVRRRGSEDSAAQFKAEFEQRWKRHFHETTTYIPHVKDAERRETLKAELDILKAKREELQAMPDAQLATATEASNAAEIMTDTSRRFSNMALTHWYRDYVMEQNRRSVRLISAPSFERF